MKTILKILTLFIGIGAIAGAVMMWIDPTGTTWGGEPLLEMLRAKMPWPDVFFKNFIPSGFVLLGLNGVTQIVAAYLLFKKHRLAQPAVLVCGIILMLWIVLEWWVWGLNALSNIYFMLGLAESVLALVNLKNPPIVSLLLLTFIMASCGDPNTQYIKKAIRIMDKNGIYAQGSNWEKAKDEALATHPQSLEEAQEIVVRAGKIAGGKHTTLMTSSEVTQNDTSAWEMPTVEHLENNIVYIKLTPFSGNAEEGIKYANTVLNALPNQLRGVVIDLRDNRGGNMYPMIASIHRFLPDDIILKFRLRRNTMEINTDYALRTAGVTRQATIDCPVALLTNEWTGSSGEAVLLCFRGLEKARTFGSPTAGYASCNSLYALPEGSQLVLTIGEDIARTGEAFCDEPIEPDILTKTPFESAIEWFFDSEK